MPKRSLPSPLVVFPALWCLGVALSQLQLLNFQTDWSARVWAVMVAVPVAFVLGGILGREPVLRRAASIRRRGRERATTSRRLRVVLVACVMVGFLELAHQWIAGTGVPLLSSEVDDTRFSAPGGPSVVLTDLLSVATIVALVVPRRLDARDARFELAVAGIATLGFVLGGGRVTVVLSLVSAFVARSLYWGLPSRRAMALGAAGIACFVVAAFYLRSSQNVDNLFEREFYGEVLPGVPFPLRPLVPLYIGLTTNFQVLASVVDHFPDSAPYGHGLYNAVGADLVISDARDLADVTGVLTSPWVTATVAGTFWADGGLPLVVVGVGLTGALSVAAYEYARLAGSLLASMIAGVLFYHAIFGVYTNLWTTHLDWILICLLLMPAAAIARDPSWPSGPLKRLAEWSPLRTADNLPAWRGRSPPE